MMIQSKTLFILLTSLLTLAVFHQTPALAQNVDRDQLFSATVIEIKEEGQKDLEQRIIPYQRLVIKITEGEFKDRLVDVDTGAIPISNPRLYSIGDKVMVTYFKTEGLEDVFYITDYLRTDALWWLLGLFLAAVVVIGRRKGLSSLLGLGITFLAIFYFLLPQISSGGNPVLLAIISSLLIVPVTFYLSHGLTSKTSVAVVGTVLALIITGFLAGFFVEFAKLSGFAAEEAIFLDLAKQGSVNIKGLLLAGIIIGALGVLDDITVSQASVVAQLKRASPTLSLSELYSRAMEVGRDHISSVVNTLILVYTGAAMPLLLLFINNPSPLSQVINLEIIAEEVVRTLVASIGLILAVPITTYLASYWIGREK